MDPYSSPYITDDSWCCFHVLFHSCTPSQLGNEDFKVQGNQGSALGLQFFRVPSLSVCDSNCLVLGFEV